MFVNFKYNAFFKKIKILLRCVFHFFLHLKIKVKSVMEDLWKYKMFNDFIGALAENGFHHKL